MADELKPCPFCGEMLEHRKPSMTSGLAWWEHPDNECVLAAIQIGDALIVFDEPEAIAAWNRRADARDAATLEAVQGWQPIETAPKDGTRFLAICSTGQVRLVRWDDPGYDRYPIGDAPGTIWDDVPTYWMPLPTPPITERKD